MSIQLDAQSLLLRTLVDDPTDVQTWTVDGRPATDLELDILRRVTLADVDNAIEHLEAKCGELERCAPRRSKPTPMGDPPRRIVVAACPASPVVRSRTRSPPGGRSAT
jgi:hypothetical protein